MAKKIALGFILLLILGTSQAAFLSGNDLYQKCTAQRSDNIYYQKATDCLGYVTGVFDEFSGMAKKGVLCLDNHISRGQIGKIFVAYANKNPKILNKAANIAVTLAIYDAFSCK